MTLEIQVLAWERQAHKCGGVIHPLKQNMTYYICLQFETSLNKCGGVK
jgi:hypothetical protein